MMGWTKGLRGGKHEMYEGGVRIPFIVRWPGKVPVDAVNDTSILSGLDAGERVALDPQAAVELLKEQRKGRVGDE